MVVGCNKIYCRPLGRTKDMDAQIQKIGDNTSMTVCIAALAENGRKAVLVADKLVSTTGILPYQTDMAADKIIKITDEVAVLFAGGITDATVIIENVKSMITGSPTAKEIADMINDEHLKYLMEILARSNIQGRGIESLERYYTDANLRLTDAIRNQIDNNLLTHTLSSNTNFIVCGKAPDGLYKVYFLNNNPRIIPALYTNSYSTIGSGWSYANFSLIQSQYDKSKTLDEVKEIVLRAKKESEKDRDVGGQQDLIVLE